MNAAAGRGRAARLWRVGAAILATLLILAALAVGALRLAIARVPENAARLQAWVEQQTGLRVEYDSLDARLRWFGPEVVLRGVRVLDQDGSQAMVSAREGSVGLDLWGLFRTGELVAGRVRFVGPALTVVRLEDGRVRLLGQNEKPLDRPPFDLDHLPAGRVDVLDATVTWRDLAARTPAITLTDLDVVLTRGRDDTEVSGSARLPAALGRRISFDGRVRGTIQRYQQIDADLEIGLQGLQLAGYAPFLPERIARPLAGGGDVDGMVRFEQGRLAHARLDVDLAEVRLALPEREVPAVEVLTLGTPTRAPGALPLSLPAVPMSHEPRVATLPREAAYPRLGGSIRYGSDGQGWSLGVRDLTFGGRIALGTARSSLSLKWRGAAVSTWQAQLGAEQLRLAEVWPLVLAFAPPSFDRWAGLAPSGTVQSLRLDASRERAGAWPRYTVSAEGRGLGCAATGAIPGFSGLDATLSGTDERGRVELRAASLGFDLPRLFSGPIEGASVAGTLDWKRSDGVLVVTSGPITVEHPQAQARARIEYRYPGPGPSPWLGMDIEVPQASVAYAGKVLPYGAFGPGATSWLAPALLGGRVVGGKVTYRGPVRRFPFRHGEGEFRATARLEDAKVNYFAGFAPLQGGNGTVDFHNAGFVAELESGRVEGLRLERARVAIVDMHDTVVEVDATASGDLSRALPFAQASPVGETLGPVFMGLTGKGAAEYQVLLNLPTHVDRHADFRVRTQLRRATVQLASLGAPVEDVSGLFEVHGLEMSSKDLVGTILGGPFAVEVLPGPLGKDVDASVALRARGRAAGAGVPAFVGLPAGITMTGATDWTLDARIDRRRDGGHWVMRYDVASTLAGLGIDAPQPFTKAPDAVRPTRVVLGYSPTGLDSVSVDSGPARVRLAFGAGPDGHVRLDRGVARFDGRPAQLPDRPGLRFAGDWPEFDLADWLALGTTPVTAAPGGASSDPWSWLGPTEVHVDKVRLYGFEFAQVDAALKPVPGALAIDVSGPAAQGFVSVPNDLAGGEPLRFDMERLHLRLAAGNGAERGNGNGVDPREVPAFEVDVRDFGWEERRLGHVQATLAKDPQGLRLARFESALPETTISAHGDWLATANGQRTRLAGELVSTDLAATARDLGLPGAIEARHARAVADLNWSGGPVGDFVPRLNGTLAIDLERGQLRDVKPGAGRMLGLTSLVELPRRLSLDFHDVTDKGLAFDTIKGTFEIRDGNAYTDDTVLKGAAIDIGLAGRTGLAAQDYDETIVVSGNPVGPATVAGALAAGPIGAAGGLLLSQLFKGQLAGLARIYYRVTGPWSDPVVERVSAQVSGEQTPQVPGPPQEPTP